MEKLNLPTSQECNKRIEKFVALTSTDSALAQFYLQDYNWEVEESSDKYFQDFTNENFAYSMLTWNINGLENKNLFVRTNVITQRILSLKPHIIFFQEIVFKDCLSIIEEKLRSIYEIIIGTKPVKSQLNYFVCTLILKEKFDVIYKNFDSFETSFMDRGLLTVSIKDKRNCNVLTLFNTHLESTNHTKYAKERVKQFLKCISKIELILYENAKNIVIFGGDLNIRNPDIIEAIRQYLALYSRNKINTQLIDFWEAYGSPSQFTFTYDPKYNANIKHYYPAKKTIDPHQAGKEVVNKGRHRFDRIYLAFNNDDFELSIKTLSGDASILNLFERYEDNSETSPNFLNISSKRHITSYFTKTDGTKKTRMVEPGLNNIKDSEPTRIIPDIISPQSKLSSNAMTSTDHVENYVKPRNIEPIAFVFVGIDKMRYGTQNYTTPPSDHWGIFISFKVESPL